MFFRLISFWIWDIEEICYSFNGYSMSSWLLTRNNSWAWKQFLCILEAFGIQFDDDCAVIHKGCWRANSCEAHFWINQSELQFWYSATFFIKNIFAPEGDTLRDGNIQLDINVRLGLDFAFIWIFVLFFLERRAGYLPEFQFFYFFAWVLMKLFHFCIFLRLKRCYIKLVPFSVKIVHA